MTDNTNASALYDEAKKVDSLVSAARRLLAEDKMVDLAALEARVTALCETVKTAPPDEAGRIKTTFESIMNHLDQLESDLSKQFKTLNEGIAHTRLHEASRAYDMPTTPAKPKQTDDEN